MDLAHQFLLAMPHQHDGYFRDSLVYVIDHSEHGAFGVTINQALDMNLGDVFSQLSIESAKPEAVTRQVLRGGPVDEGHGLVLHPQGPQFQSTRDFNNGISLSSSRDALEALAVGEAPHTYCVLLGHAGWAPGQLEMEIADNAWLSCAADRRIVFNTPLPERRQAVGQLLGIDITQIVGHAGHA